MHPFLVCCQVAHLCPLLAVGYKNLVDLPLFCLFLSHAILPVLRGMIRPSYSGYAWVSSIVPPAFLPYKLYPLRFDRFYRVDSSPHGQRSTGWWLKVQHFWDSRSFDISDLSKMATDTRGNLLDSRNRFSWVCKHRYRGFKIEFYISFATSNAMAIAHNSASRTSLFLPKKTLISFQLSRFLWVFT